MSRANTPEAAIACSPATSSITQPRPMPRFASAWIETRIPASSTSTAKATASTRKPSTPARGVAKTKAL